MITVPGNHRNPIVCVEGSVRDLTSYAMLEASQRFFPGEYIVCVNANINFTKHPQYGLAVFGPEIVEL